jgi:hypothetical protein
MGTIPKAEDPESDAKILAWHRDLLHRAEQQVMGAQRGAMHLMRVEIALLEVAGRAYGEHALHAETLARRSELSEERRRMYADDAASWRALDVEAKRFIERLRESLAGIEKHLVHLKSK